MYLNFWMLHSKKFSDIKSHRKEELELEAKKPYNFDKNPKRNALCRNRTAKDHRKKCAEI